MPIMLYYPRMVPPREVIHQALLYWDGIATVVPAEPEEDLQRLTGDELHSLREHGLYFPLAPDWEEFAWRGVDESEVRSQLQDCLQNAPPLGDGTPLYRLHFGKVGFALRRTLVEYGLTQGAQGRGLQGWTLVKPEACHIIFSAIVRGLVDIQGYRTRASSIDDVPGALFPFTDMPAWHRLAHTTGHLPRLRWEMEIGPLLPTPAPDTQTADVLAFRDRYRDERQRLMRALHRLLGELRRDYEHPKDIFEQFKRELEDAVDDYRSAAHSSRMVWLNTPLAVAVALGAAAGGSLLAPDLGWLLGTVSGFALNVATRETRLTRLGAKDHDFSYLHRVTTTLT